jgi:hypothetical protein
MLSQAQPVRGIDAIFASEYRGEYVLVCGNLNTVPQLVKSLTGQNVTLREDEYDAMFIVFVPQISKKRVVRVRY